MVIPRDSDLPHLGWGPEVSLIHPTSGMETGSLSYTHPEGFCSKWSEITLLTSPGTVGGTLNSRFLITDSLQVLISLCRC